jgi:hypothetical protein
VIRIDLILVLLPVATFLSNVLAFLFSGDQRLFFEAAPGLDKPH